MPSSRLVSAGCLHAAGCCLRPQSDGMPQIEKSIAKISEKVWRLRIFLLPLPISNGVPVLRAKDYIFLTI